MGKALTLEPAVGRRFELRLLGRHFQEGDLSHQGNILTIIRLLLASAVVFSHAFIITKPYGSVSRDPSLSILPYSVSRMAVFLFFTLSGFLVCKSLSRTSTMNFILARALRVVPGLYVMLAVMTVILGCLFSELPFWEYAQRPGVWRYIFRHATFRNGAFYLDGVFNHNYAADVNVSIWTIAYEVRCYVGLAIAGLLGLLKRRTLVLPALLATVFYSISGSLDYESFLTSPVTMTVSFMIGVVFWLFRERLFLSWPLAILASIVIAWVPPEKAYASLTQFLIGYSVIVLAVLVPNFLKRKSAQLPDYSYGLYIYGFPAQQSALALGVGVSAYQNMAIGFAIAMPFAILSWHLVESPAMRQRSRITNALGLADR